MQSRKHPVIPVKLVPVETGKGNRIRGISQSGSITVDTPGPYRRTGPDVRNEGLAGGRNLGPVDANGWGRATTRVAPTESRSTPVVEAPFVGGWTTNPYIGIGSVNRP